jgi:RNA polymerase sigma-70 factor (ECF subfamily)
MAATYASASFARPASSGAAGDGDLERLLERCARRDPQAFQALYERAAPQLLACLMRILRRRAVAEEALQDVFVSIWERSDQYQSYRGRAMAWLVSVARYRAIDLLRRDARRPALVMDQAELSQVPAEEDPAGEALTARDASALGHCLGQLESQQRRCVELAFVEGRSHADIATVTGSPLGTVKSWVRRGLLSLRRCLER